MAKKAPEGVNKPKSKSDTPANRRLIRPNLSEIKDRMPARASWRKQAPPEQTNAESFYYLKQMSSKTPMVFVLTDGEIIRGTLEWYDRACVKVNRDDGPNLLLMKHCLKYAYKETPDDDSGA